MSVVSFCAPRLSEDQRERWREFIGQCPCARYTQDPAWAEVEHSSAGPRGRSPYFFWCERDGRICLTAVGVRRRLPIPGRVYWEFENGPNVLEPAVLDEWLGWLPSALGRGAARVLLQPAALLDETGDQMETILDARGFVRRRTFGIWSTLIIDLDRPEEEILGSFRPKTRRTIRRAADEGVVVATEDTPEGWAALVALGAEVAARAPVQPIDPRFVKAISERWLAGGSRGTVLVVRHQGEPIAAKLVVTYRLDGDRALDAFVETSREDPDEPYPHLGSDALGQGPRLLGIRPRRIRSRGAARRATVAHQHVQAWLCASAAPAEVRRGARTCLLAAHRQLGLRRQADADVDTSQGGTRDNASRHRWAGPGGAGVAGRLLGGCLQKWGRPCRAAGIWSMLALGPAPVGIVTSG